MKRAISILMLFTFAAAAESVHADIYRLEGDNETVVFTDSPTDKRFQLVMKEPRGARSKKENSRQIHDSSNYEAGGGAPTAAIEHGSRNLPIQGRITSPTGLRSDPFDGKLKHHNGLDIAAPSGTPVKPVAPGTVIFSGWKNGYGNTVILDHHDGMITVYAHHASNSVTVGAPVDSGTVIARSGSSGRSTGPHLHFEAWRNGINITQDFMPGTMTAEQSRAAASPPINRYLQADGTIIFTNLR